MCGLRGHVVAREQTGDDRDQRRRGVAVECARVALGRHRQRGWRDFSGGIGHVGHVVVAAAVAVVDHQAAGRDGFACARMFGVKALRGFCGDSVTTKNRADAHRRHSRQMGAVVHTRHGLGCHSQGRFVDHPCSIRHVSHVVVAAIVAVIDDQAAGCQGFASARVFVVKALRGFSGHAVARENRADAHRRYKRHIGAIVATSVGLGRHGQGGFCDLTIGSRQSGHTAGQDVITGIDACQGDVVHRVTQAGAYIPLGERTNTADGKIVSRQSPGHAHHHIVHGIGAVVGSGDIACVGRHGPGVHPQSAHKHRGAHKITAHHHGRGILHIVGTYNRMACGAHRRQVVGGLHIGVQCHRDLPTHTIAERVANPCQRVDRVVNAIQISGRGAEDWRIAINNGLRGRTDQQSVGGHDGVVAILERDGVVAGRQTTGHQHIGVGACGHIGGRIGAGDVQGAAQNSGLLPVHQARILHAIEACGIGSGHKTGVCIGGHRQARPVDRACGVIHVVDDVVVTAVAIGNHQSAGPQRSAWAGIRVGKVLRSGRGHAVACGCVNRATEHGGHRRRRGAVVGPRVRLGGHGQRSPVDRARSVHTGHFVVVAAIAVVDHRQAGRDGFASARVSVVKGLREGAHAVACGGVNRAGEHRGHCRRIGAVVAARDSLGRQGQGRFGDHACGNGHVGHVVIGPAIAISNDQSAGRDRFACACISVVKALRGRRGHAVAGEQGNAEHRGHRRRIGAVVATRVGLGRHGQGGLGDLPHIAHRRGGNRGVAKHRPGRALGGIAGA